MITRLRKSRGITLKMPAEDGYWSINDINEPLWIAILSAVVCLLSMFGSFAIVLAFACVKTVRSKARELLVHLSLMDFIYSTANLIGLWLPYQRHLLTNNTGTSDYSTYHGVCRAQAFLAIYGTIGSVLWTLGLAVYLYYRIVSRDHDVTKKVVIVLYILCYLLPLYVTVWLLVKGGLGYSNSPLSGGGWCSISGDIDPLENFMTYDIWMWLGIVVLTPLYLLIHSHIREEIKRSRNPDYRVFVGSKNPDKIKTEVKLLFIPLVFIFLRVWDVIDGIMFVYHPSPAYTRNYHWLQPLTAIGDCGQGFFNFIIFFVFQPQLRQSVCCFCCKKASQLWVQLEGDEGVSDEPDKPPNDETVPGGHVPVAHGHQNLYL